MKWLRRDSLVINKIHEMSEICKLFTKLCNTCYATIFNLCRVVNGLKVGQFITKFKKNMIFSSCLRAKRGGGVSLVFVFIKLQKT